LMVPEENDHIDGRPWFKQGAESIAKEANLARLMSFDWTQLLIGLLILATIGFWAKLISRLILVLVAIGLIAWFFLWPVNAVIRRLIVKENRIPRSVIAGVNPLSLVCRKPVSKPRKISTEFLTSNSRTFVRYCGTQLVFSPSWTSLIDAYFRLLHTVKPQPNW